MKEFIVYLLKSGIVLAVFWSIYCLFLRKDTFHTFNRFFLLAGLAASFLLPLYCYRYPVILNLGLTASDALPTQPATSAPCASGVWPAALAIYALGGILLAIRYFAGILKIKKLIQKQGYTQRDGLKIVKLPGATSTFSIFSYVVSSSSYDASEAEQKLVYEHEKAHISQRHVADLLLSYMVCITQWFNPFAWLYLHAIKQNHEYLADKAVLQSGYSPALYRAALINHTLNAPVFAFSHAFTQYNKFKRLNMMTKKSSQPAKKLATLLLIPAFAAFFWAFSEPEYVAKTTNPQPSAQADTADAALAPALANALLNVTADTTRAKKPYVIVDGKEYTKGLHTIDPNDIESISVLKDEAAIQQYGKKGENGVVIITSKAVVITASKAANQHKAKHNAAPQARTAADSSKQAHSSAKNASDAKKKPLVIVDGQEYSGDWNKIDQSSILSVSVLKDKFAVEAYGEKGRNGVIIIKLRTSE
ncbi:MAG: hypothetical protein LBJ57_02800 [Prevotellaceae bacterium]|jgi:TonB-dependent SusC/RagA subfamily outer membrane receptor|nr:hypothetical protein [Prevotellaceae bacterium]